MHDHLKIEKNENEFLVTLTEYRTLSKKGLLSYVADIVFDQPELLSDGWIAENKIKEFMRESGHSTIVCILNEMAESYDVWQNYFIDAIQNRDIMQRIKNDLDDNITNVFMSIDYVSRTNEIRSMVLDYINEKRKLIIGDKIDNLKNMMTYLTPDEKEEFIKGLYK